jgi:hypothetical protein
MLHRKEGLWQSQKNNALIVTNIQRKAQPAEHTAGGQ